MYKAFLWPLLIYASPGWFPFQSVTNISKLERLHQAASHTISSSPIPLLLSEMSLPFKRVTLTHFALSSYKRALCPPTSYPISCLAKHDSADRPGEFLHPLIRSCSLLLLLVRLSLFVLPHLLETCLPSLWSSLFLPILLL